MPQEATPPASSYTRPLPSPLPTSSNGNPTPYPSFPSLMQSLWPGLRIRSDIDRIRIQSLRTNRIRIFLSRFLSVKRHSKHYFVSPSVRSHDPASLRSPELLPFTITKKYFDFRCLPKFRLLSYLHIVFSFVSLPKKFTTEGLKNFAYYTFFKVL